MASPSRSSGFHGLLAAAPEMRSSPFLFAEEAPRTDDQHDGHQQENQHKRDLRQDQDAESVEQRDEDRRDKRAFDRSKAADHDDNEDLDDDAQVHRMVDGVARRLQRAAKTREKGAEGEDAREQPLLIDAERRDHVPVLRRRPDQRAPARAAQRNPEQAQHERPERDQEQIVGRNALAQDDDRAQRAPARAGRANPPAPRSGARGPPPRASRRKSREAGTIRGRGRSGAGAGSRTPPP